MEKRDRENVSTEVAHSTEVAYYQKSLIREVIEVIVYAVAILFFVNGFVWQNFQIPTESMENTLLIGDHLTVNTFMFQNATPLEKRLFPFRAIRRGDVMVFKFPKDVRQDFIKRCVGMPGDRFEIIEDRIFLDGTPLQETYSFYKSYRDHGRDPNNSFRPVRYGEMKPGLENGDRFRKSVSLQRIRNDTVSNLGRFKQIDPESYRNVIRRLNRSDPDVIPEGFYLMMGDNRNLSADSRAWGLVPKELIQGRAWFVWWSYGEDEGSHELEGWARVWSYLRVPITFWTRTHWQESFTFIK